jgi:Zn ribbon nucleic-acid-binding protein
MDAAKRPMVWPKSTEEITEDNEHRLYCADNGLCPKCHAQDLADRIDELDGKYEQCNACGWVTPGWIA